MPKKQTITTNPQGKVSKTISKKSKSIVNPIPKQIVNTTKHVGKNQFVYIIQEREFINSGEPVYKIGKTTQEPSRRMDGYPKGSRILLYIDVQFSGCHFMERNLIAEFDRLYIHREDIGRESYEGDPEQMKATFLRVVRTIDHLHEVPPKYFWLKKCLIWCWRLITV
jgi:T5orf172 domain